MRKGLIREDAKVKRVLEAHPVYYCNCKLSVVNP